MSDASSDGPSAETERETDGPDSAPHAPTWKTLFGGMVRPGRHMVLTQSSCHGPSYFFLTYSLYCLVPMFLVHLLMVVLEPGMSAIRFHDINPKTMLVSLPAQLLIGPVIIFVFAGSMRLGLTMAGLVPDSDSGRLRTTSWYVGTLLVCLYGWWLGILVTFASIRSIDGDVLDTLVPVLTLLEVAVFFRVMLVAYHRNSPAVAGKWGRVVGGVMGGSIIFLLAIALLGVIARVLLVMAIGR